MDNYARNIVDGIRSNYDVMFVIGIGGSYAGSKSAIDLLDTDFPVEFIGYGFESNVIDRIWQKYQNKRIKVCVISKSGKTYEIMANFNYIELKLKEKYGNDFTNHIVAITGEDGLLKKYVDDFHIQHIKHPDIGGRYSVLSIVGLFPMAVAGIDTDEILKGANDSKIKEQILIEEYARNRFEQYQSGKYVEVFAVSSLNALQFGNWYQQLFGESEGKNKKGMWTSVLVYSRDLHSMGQFIQQGSPILCETIINIKDKANSLSHLNEVCIEAVEKAHQNANIKVTKIDLNKTPYDLGRLFNLFMSACMLYCEYINVDAFNQPGVEDYKNEMRKLLK